MIKISIPNNNQTERKYIIDIIFNELLGIECALELGSENYEIVLENDSRLIFKDSFFSQFPNKLDYLEFDNIPKKVQFIKNQFTAEDDIPVIFGDSELEIQENSIFCGIDIFASIFFMLTRWEEYVNKNRDNHNRFPATESIAFKHNFLDRPVVNEYVEMLKNMFLFLDDNLKFKIQNPQLFLTHDVDNLYMWKGWGHVFRVVAGDLLKRRNISLAVSRMIEYKNIKQGKIKDPFDTFDWLIEKSESVGAQSRFYFMSGGVTEFDNHYRIDEPKCLSLIEKIKARGHIIGFHPSYNAYDDSQQFKQEKELLEKTVGQKTTEGREHYLRFEVPTTWQIWEDNGMQVDSTCGYSDKEGFRCGTGDEFSVFNILTRRHLGLKERPLIVMEGSFLARQSIEPKEMERRINKLISQAKKYNSGLVLLWHNSSFNTRKWCKYQYIYEKMTVI